jgi:hypothetical protein
MRRVKMIVWNTPVGEALTWAYPDGDPSKHYIIPTYELDVSGTDGAGRPVHRTFEVLRFGLQFKRGFDAPHVVGLADQQTHDIKAWIPTYSVHSARSLEKGAWQIYGNFLIHDGPDNQKTEVYATIGCIEVCGAPRGFDMFNDLLIQLSGPKARGRASQLQEIGRARNMHITYMKASRPAIKPS